MMQLKYIKINLNHFHMKMIYYFHKYHYPIYHQYLLKAD
jgi:hypothetical protein